MKRLLALAVSLLMAGASAHAQNFTNGFPFSLPWNDSSTQRFLPAFPAEPITGFVGIDGSGHFAVNGERIRFWGVNNTTGGCFPVSAKAPLVAARMRKMGINLVRFHHMDNPWGDNNSSIFIQNQGASTRSLNPVTLDRLHFFLNELKQNGIYANLNLNVSRTFRTTDGVQYADSILDFGKAVTLFDRQLIGLQKEYARQLLTTINPYTGLAPINDPVVGLVEIANENTLYGAWKDGWLKPFAQGGHILKRQSDTLDLRWSQFLQQKYPTQQALATAYNQGAAPGGQNQQITNGGFETGTFGTNWSLEQQQGATGAIIVSTTNPHSGNYCAQAQVLQATGTSWHMQFKHVGGNLLQGHTYEVSFAARATQAASVGFTVMRDNAPYTWYDGFNVNLTTQWQVFSFTFTAPENNNGQFRFSLGLGDQTGTFWLDDISVADPVVNGLLPGENLASGTVYRADYQQINNYTPARQRDLAEFYLTLQRDYFAEMRQFLRDSLGVQVPITGTNALGGISDLYTQQDMDYTDDHAYWDHPWFPNIPWSATDWQISNQPMLKSQGGITIDGIFSGMAMEGKPFTVSEYRHPFPNRYEVEMMPWMYAYLSLHDADGVMFFEYSGEYSDWETDRVTGYFGIHRNNLQMALSPVFAAAFRQGLTPPDTEPLSVEYSPSFIFGLPAVDNQGRWGKYLPYDGRLGREHSIRTAGFASTDSAPDLSVLPTVPSIVYSTANGATQVNLHSGVLTTASPKFASITGELNQTAFYQTGPLLVYEGNDFGTVNWMSLTDEVLSRTPVSLLALAAKIQNTNMTWYDNNGSIRNSWGTAPTQLSPLSVKLSLQIEADSIRLYPLSSRGHDSTHFTVFPVSANVFQLNLDLGVRHTPWYGIEAFGGNVSIDKPETGMGRLWPNPSTGELVFQFANPSPQSAVLTVFDLSGKAVFTEEGISPPNGFLRRDLQHLPAGMYLVRVAQAGRVFSGKWRKE